MTEEPFNLIFNGEVESGRDLDGARSTLESLFEFDPENQVDFFNGEAVILGKNMNATTPNSFKQALASADILTHLLAAEDTNAVRLASGMMECETCHYSLPHVTTRYMDATPWSHYFHYWQGDNARCCG